jgi:hypothetical protein
MTQTPATPKDAKEPDDSQDFIYTGSNTFMTLLSYVGGMAVTQEVRLCRGETVSLPAKHPVVQVLATQGLLRLVMPSPSPSPSSSSSSSSSAGDAPEVKPAAVSAVTTKSA